jgi:glycosyltransferase involved in cell wall biosynthesis
LEILVIDDCSQDDSVAVLRSYEGDPRVRLVLRSDNGGWVTVSNQGVGLAQGEYVLFANCDDACEPTLVARLCQALERCPSAGLAFCRSLMIDEEGDVLGTDFEMREPTFQARCATDTLLTSAEATDFLRRSCVIPNLSAALFRKSCLEEAGLLSSAYRVCSDWDLFFRIARRHDVAYVGEPLNHFRQHRKTIRSSTNEGVVVEEYLRLLLSEVHTAPMSSTARWRARADVMHLWAVHLLAPSAAGLRNLSHHTGVVRRYDPLALVMAPLAFARRIAELGGKAVGIVPRSTMQAVDLTRVG